ncbi:zinc finger protein [Durotheca rogersii]|uniref:zinc finger protein n=1 Tax=Durotheca rogersii TaxID=419775 RepID=UPI002220EF2E|nr:zinc finger protein [Durotheca rogersii]KAI5859339.1 zinc finger protein [Durotheca rogersii]
MILYHTNLHETYTYEVATDSRKWFDCADCHREQESHELLQTLEMTFACKKCRKCFRKDAQEFEEADEYCPHCDNHFVLDAVVPKPALAVEGDDARVDSRMLRDERVKNPEARRIFDIQPDADKLG